MENQQIFPGAKFLLANRGEVWYNIKDFRERAGVVQWQNVSFPS